MDIFVAFVKGFLFSLTLCFDLGLVNVTVMKVGIEKGFKSSFTIGLGSGVGDMIYLLLSLMGLSIIFENRLVKWFLWIAGTVILLYLTWQMMKEAISPNMVKSSKKFTEHSSSMKDFLWGVGLALSSPTAIIWFAVTVGAILTTINIKNNVVLASFLLGFFLAGALWALVTALVSSKTGKLLSKRVVRSISIFSALIFLSLAAKVFLNGYHEIIK